MISRSVRRTAWLRRIIAVIGSVAVLSLVGGVAPAAAAVVPSAPTIGVATAGERAATVTWTAPASNGGSAVTGYVVTPYVGYWALPSVTFTTTATTQVITGLQVGTIYRFKVQAVNAVGRSALSAISNAVHPFGDLGTVTEVSSPGECSLDECSVVDVACPGVPTLSATVAIRYAAGVPKGVAVLLSGALGTTLWARPFTAQEKVVDDLAAGGLEVAQVAWSGDGWGAAPAGQSLGYRALSCRSATIVKWLHDVRYVPLGLAPATGVCGFCVSGNSGGASQTAYALAFFGLDQLIDAAVLTSGPPHGGIGLGCTGPSGDPGYIYGRFGVTVIDAAYGYPGGAGPCTTGDSTYADVWAADSVDTGGYDHVHTTTRVEILLGDLDRSVAPAHAVLYHAELVAAGSPIVSLQEVPGMDHEVHATDEGQAAVLAALLEGV